MMNDKELEQFVDQVRGMPPGTVEMVAQMRAFRLVEQDKYGSVSTWATVGEALINFKGCDGQTVEAAVLMLDGPAKPAPKRKRRSKEEIAADKAAAAKRQAAIDAAPTQSLPPAAPEVPSLTQPQQPAETDDEKLARLTSEAAARRAAPAPEGVDPMATHPHVTPPPPPPPATLPDGGVVATMELPDLSDE